jgi:hypothetical protein
MNAHATDRGFRREGGHRPESDPPRHAASTAVGDTIEATAAPRGRPGPRRWGSAAISALIAVSLCSGLASPVRGADNVAPPRCDRATLSDVARDVLRHKAGGRDLSVAEPAMPAATATEEMPVVGAPELIAPAADLAPAREASPSLFRRRPHDRRERGLRRPRIRDTNRTRGASVRLPSERSPFHRARWRRCRVSIRRRRPAPTDSAHRAGSSCTAFSCRTVRWTRRSSRRWPGSAYGTGRVSGYVSHWDITNNDGYTTQKFYGTVSAFNIGYETIFVPPLTKRLVVAMTWDEPPASAGASRAVIYDIDLWVDYNPDCASPTGACGEYSSRSTVDNVEYVSIDNPPSGYYRLTRATTASRRPERR